MTSLEAASLSRLKQDCDYVLGAGGGHLKHLLYSTVALQIAEMRRLYAYCLQSEELAWIDSAVIDSYEARLNALAVA